jgi:membrane-bound lytic murein transglycosylase D
VITETGNAHDILLPVSAANTFKDNLASYNTPLVSWQTYHAKRGERMDKIAQKFGINVSQLRDVNDLSSGKKLSGAQPMLVPSSAGNSDSSPVDTDASPVVEEKATPKTKQNGKNKVTHDNKKHEDVTKAASEKTKATKKSSTKKKTKHQAG